MRRAAVVSCHVERLLDDDVWPRLERFLARRPGGFEVAPLVRPPDPDAGESQADWAERVRRAAQLGPLGHHTHFGGPTHARPRARDEKSQAAERVRKEAEAFRVAGVRPRFFCGGGWYMDEAVAAAVADLGYADCTATSYRQPYLAPDAPRVQAPAPVWLRLPDGRRLLELPATRSVGMLLRGLPRLDEEVVHVHFHDWDLASVRTRAALVAGLRALRLTRRPISLAELAARDPGRELDFSAAARS